MGGSSIDPRRGGGGVTNGLCLYILYICNELRGNMARSTQFPIMITRWTIIYEIVSPGTCCRQQHIHLIWFQIYDPGGPNPHGRV